MLLHRVKNMNVVGIGASAGGLKALLDLFKSIPEEPNCAFVVVQHLSPDFKSMMSELLARISTIPIEYVKENTKLENNRIYLIPPKNFISITDGIFHLEDRNDKATQHAPIDLFFTSLAENYQNDAIAIILSGSGTDGTHGAQKVFENGGLVITQDDTAEFASMPESVNESGYFHKCLSPEKIFTVIKEYIETSILPVNITAPQDQNVLDILKAHTSIDYTHYKSSTLDRRIMRQISAREMTDVNQYTELLLKNTKTIDELNEDILIGVTEFFRDIDEFNFLDEEIAKRVLKTAPSECRVWIAGCSTGEEVYSIAICLHEAAERINYQGKICIFATDVNKKAIETASEGEYTQAKFTLMPDRLIQKYFDKSGGIYKIRSFIRKNIIFAQQNLLQDPPFTRMNLVSCRNMLIYLKLAAQEKLINMFHFCLQDEGILFLGSSEGLGSLEKKYHTIEKSHKFYQKLGQSHMPLRVSNEPTFRRDFQREIKNDQTTISKDLLKAYDYILAKELGEGFLVNSNHEIVHYFGKINQYMTGIVGRKEDNFVNSFEGDLKIALSTSFNKATKNKEYVLSKGVKHIAFDSSEKIVDLSVSPIAIEANNYLYHIAINEVDTTKPQVDDSTVSAINYEPDKELHQRVLDLESELKSTRENLQITVEELQTSNEELQATIEEMSAANEELQSTNEELHSVNEELYTVNAELEVKNNDLTELNQDMENLLINLDIGILFVDKELNIRKFNPSIASIFNLLDNDIGRPISHIAYHLDDQKGMNSQLIKVINTGQSISEEIKGVEGMELLKQVYPYKDSMGKIQGAILTFTKIAELKKLNNRLKLAIKTANIVWWDWDIENDEFTMYPGDWCILGYTPNDMKITSKTWYKMTHPDDLDRVKKSLDSALSSTEGYWESEHRYRTYQAKWAWVLDTGQVTHWSSDGRPLRMVGATQRIDKRKVNELRLQNLLKEARAAISAKSNFLTVISHEMRTPLNPILGLLDFMRDASTMEEVNEYVDLIREAAESLSGLINNILDYSSISSGHVEFIQQNVCFNQVLNSIYLEQKTKFEEKGLELKLKLPEDEVFSLGDQDYFTKAINHLVRNAFKFTKEGYCEIKLGATQKDAIITVTDTGIGIAPEKLEKIFDQFLQGNMSSTRAYEGLGLGLSSTKLLIEAMDGEISIVPDSKKTIFQILVPLSKLNSKVLQIETKIPKLDNVLLIEDDKYNQTTLRGYLKDTAYRIDVAESVFDGVQRYKESAYDLVILDFLLPDGDAIDFLSKVNDNHSNFLVYTANRLSLDQKLLHQFNVHKILDKPASKQKFSEAVQELLNTKYKNIEVAEK